MREYLTLSQPYRLKKPLAIALGFFDGVHLGHRHVIAHVLHKKEEGFTPAVFTFSHTRRSFNRDNGFIYPLSHRKEQLKELGAEVLLCPVFSDFLSMSPREFVRILAENFQVKYIVCGDDFTFGKNKVGNAETLRELSREFSVEVEVVPPLLVDGERVSSTKIKEHLLKGEVQQANKLLGAPYCMSGIVRTGKQLGRTVERPTANQHFEDGQLIPRFGAYSSVVLLEGREWHCSSNIGMRPTVGGEFPICETFIMHYQGDLYGDFLKVYFFEFMRTETKFNSLEEIKENIVEIALHAKEKGYSVM